MTASPPMPPLPPLTLIVATTPTLGIGLRGSLPWPPLKSDLAFFARVTKRPPLPFSKPGDHVSTPETKAINAVIMGRKTWDSIPSRFRPLKGRVNVVISRDESVRESCSSLEASDETKTMGAESISEAIQGLQGCFGSKDSQVRLGRVFVIGGASIYEQAMGMECCDRILWTRIRKEFECDVHFPGGGGLGEHEGRTEWQQKSREELRQWCGEESVGGVQTEGDVEFEVQMWEKAQLKSARPRE
ncbi:MAG: hypothetical protein Q9195_001288 [Heterodermia aff. obscurata]